MYEKNMAHRQDERILRTRSCHKKEVRYIQIVSILKKDFFILLMSLNSAVVSILQKGFKHGYQR